MVVSGVSAVSTLGVGVTKGLTSGTVDAAKRSSQMVVSSVNTVSAMGAGMTNSVANTFKFASGAYTSPGAAP